MKLIKNCKNEYQGLHQRISTNRGKVRLESQSRCNEPNRRTERHSSANEPVNENTSHL